MIEKEFFNLINKIDIVVYPSDIYSLELPAKKYYFNDKRKELPFHLFPELYDILSCYYLIFTKYIEEDDFYCFTGQFYNHSKQDYINDIILYKKDCFHMIVNIEWEEYELVKYKNFDDSLMYFQLKYA